MALTHQTRCLEYSRTVAPGGESLIEVPGSFFRIKEASGAFFVGLDSEPVFAFDLGMAYQCPPGLPFRLIHVVNPGPDPLTITVLVGQGYIFDDRLNVIRERGSLPVIEVPTKTFGHVSNSIAAFSELSLPGTPTGLQLQRKTVVISNLDIASYLVVKDADGNRCNVVFPSTTIALFVSGPLSVANETALPITAYVSEVFFMAA